MRKVSADIIFPISSTPLFNHVLILDDNGKILDIQPKENFEDVALEKYSGAVVPGFVNTHCHIELSHLKNKFPEKTGLPGFLKLVMGEREAEKEIILDAIQNAEKEMIENGIVAVGDISNSEISFQRKSKHNIYYHTFLELFSLNPVNASMAFEKGKKIFTEAKNTDLNISLAAHAPYSVCPELIRLITTHCFQNEVPTTIHMLESNDENEMYVQGTGTFRKFYREIGIKIDFFQPTGKTSLQSLLPSFNNEVKTLFVHNTIATANDIEDAEQKNKNLSWCFCPNANLFIENRLPDIPQLMNAMSNITIGTDSLSSNHNLNVLNELKTIQKHFPEIKTEDLLKWSTINGAEFLGIESTFGSFEIGKSPGVNLIEQVDLENFNLSRASVKKIF